ncbi:DNA translocase FtsK [Serratia fonticola]|uniref:DNA translocase FtsK n=1 Tax=Serratia fonticola TaxID=47917 RepID=UPI0028A97D12|nr:DNA translocase FtsK [Serratia fonticola]
MLNFGTALIPALDLLSAHPVNTFQSNNHELDEMARAIESSLALYNIVATVVDISKGPVFTLFELQLAPGVMVRRVVALEHDLARALSAERLRVLRTMPGKPYIRIEILNKHRQTVYLREVLDSSEFKDSSSPLTVALGKDITGQPVVADLARMPHLLIGGMTGSGKSVLLDTMIISMLYKATPETLRFIMIDSKMLDLSFYRDIPHLLMNLITDMKEATHVLQWCVTEMERRYRLMSAFGVRNLAGFNMRIDQAEAMGQRVPDPFWKPSTSMDNTPAMLVKEPRIVVIVDNFAELMLTIGEQIREVFVSLAQKAHVAGIHLILSTSLPSTVVIANPIKASIPARVSLTVRSKGDSNTILDQGGAELLLGAGDMLYMGLDSVEPQRVHCALISEHEINAVVRHWQTCMPPQYQKGIFTDGEALVEESSREELDSLFDEAVVFVVDKRGVSISSVQHQFRIGYNRAARIIEQMEAQGIVSKQGHDGNREVLAPSSLLGLR